MGVSIITDDDHACLFCNTTMWAFGPVFHDAEAARSFKRYVRTNYDDPRTFGDQRLQELRDEWREREDE